MQNVIIRNMKIAKRIVSPIFFGLTIFTFGIYLLFLLIELPFYYIKLSEQLSEVTMTTQLLLALIFDSIINFVTLALAITMIVIGIVKMIKVIGRKDDDNHTVNSISIMLLLFSAFIIIGQILTITFTIILLIEAESSIWLEINYGSYVLIHMILISSIVTLAMKHGFAKRICLIADSFFFFLFPIVTLSWLISNSVDMLNLEKFYYAMLIFLGVFALHLSAFLLVKYILDGKKKEEKDTLISDSSSETTNEEK